MRKAKYISFAVFLIALMVETATSQSTYQVNSANDFPAAEFYQNPDSSAYQGTLRWAVWKSNNDGMFSYISFDFPRESSITIQLVEGLDSIIEPVSIIDPLMISTGLYRITISGLTGTVPGVDYGLNLIGADGSIVRGIRFWGFRKAGVILSQSDNCTIDHVKIAFVNDNDPSQLSYGILLVNSSFCYLSGNIVSSVTDNTAIVYGCGIGLIKNSQSQSDCSSNSVIENEIGACVSYGILVKSQAEPSQCQKNKLSRNIICGNEYPVFLDNANNEKDPPEIMQFYADSIVGKGEIGDTVEVFSSDSINCINSFLGSAVVLNDSSWTLISPRVTSTVISTSSTDSSGNTSTIRCAAPVTPFSVTSGYCIGDPTLFQISFSNPGNYTSPIFFEIDFGDGTIESSSNIYATNTYLYSHVYSSDGFYTYTMTTLNINPYILHEVSYTLYIENCDENNTLPCDSCYDPFSPIPGKKYILSAWVKEENSTQLNYTGPSILVLYPDISAQTGPYYASGEIIEGWQRIYTEFDVPPSAHELTIRLVNNGNNAVYFDDIRIHPYDANMKSYVYDIENMRFIAELDENNYATFYEYDDEGKLIRLKKETERGIMTIKEYRQEDVKQSAP